MKNVTFLGGGVGEELKCDLRTIRKKHHQKRRGKNRDRRTSGKREQIRGGISNLTITFDEKRDKRNA